MSAAGHAFLTVTTIYRPTVPDLPVPDLSGDSKQIARAIPGNQIFLHLPPHSRRRPYKRTAAIRPGSLFRVRVGRRGRLGTPDGLLFRLVSVGWARPA
jgi:hypothetical protein